MSLRSRRLAVVLLHLGLTAVSSYSALWLRFDGSISPADWDTWLGALPGLLVVRAAVFGLFGLYQGLWRYVGIWDLRNIVAAVISSSAVHYVLVRRLLGWTGYPRSVFIIDSLLLILLMGGVRMIRRTVSELRHEGDRKRVLVYGAGSAGEVIVRDMKANPQQPYYPIGLLDDDHFKVGQRLHGVRVLGTRDDVPRILRQYNPDEILIAIPRADPAGLRAILRTLEPYKIPIKTLPNLRDIFDGRVEVRTIRSLAVEDLLSRAPVGLDQAPVCTLIAGRRVLVTGAGGSIGSELCRQIARLRPASLAMVERYENSLHAIRLELEELDPNLGATAIVGDVTDRARLHEVLRRYRPEIVFHAAAHKHVPLMEEHPCEAIKNNVRGTRILAQAAEAHGVDRFILISTDKAVNPSSVMGASKRLAEMTIQRLAKGSGTSFSIVRFGNVLGSNGSVVPRFLDQINRGGPVTITHPAMRRFFMLIPEAVQLVLHAAAQAESGAVYVLEMGEPVRLLDMARDLIRLAGFVPDEDVRIEFTGTRPGEKLEEELVGSDEEAVPSQVDKILCVRSRRALAANLLSRIALLERAAADGRTETVLHIIHDLVPSFPASRAAAKAGAPDPTPAERPAHRPASELLEEAQTCPRCTERLAYRSHSRTVVERARKRLGHRRLFRCGACGWRGWLEPLDSGMADPVDAPAGPPDLSIIDAAVSVNAAPARPVFSPRDLG
jgi:FlaA1/EpsC-like NDP-sugar epimerase